MTKIQKRKVGIIMNKLEVRICKCGRLHFYQNELLDKLLEEEKELVLICSRCGNVMHIGADIEPASFFYEDANPEEIVFNMYSSNTKNEEISQENFNQELMNSENKRTIGKIIIDEGIGVYMNTGYTADYYGNDGFADYGSTFDRVKKYTSLEVLERDLNDYEKRRVQVKMKNLLETLTDDQADALSCFRINGLDWTGTKWEKH